MGLAGPHRRPVIRQERFVGPFCAANWLPVESPPVLNAPNDFQVLLETRSARPLAPEPFPRILLLDSVSRPGSQWAASDLSGGSPGGRAGVPVA